MKLNYLRAFIVLVAGLIISVCNIKNGINSTTALVRLFWVLIIFYILGTIVIAIIKKVQEMPDASRQENLEEENLTDGNQEGDISQE